MQPETMERTDLLTLQPVLRTERLQLRPARAEDLNTLWVLWGDAEVRRYLFDDEPVTREHAAELLGANLRLGAEGLGLWLVHPRGTLQAVGCVGLLRSTVAAPANSAQGQAVEPVVALRPDQWGRGYAHEALSALVRYAFATLRLQELCAVTDVPNRLSDRMLRRAGFVPQHETDGARYRLRLYRLAAQQPAA